MLEDRSRVLGTRTRLPEPLPDLRSRRNGVGDRGSLEPRPASWLGKLRTITEVEVAIMMSNVPHGRISDTAIEFASKLILINKNRLVEVGKDLR